MRLRLWLTSALIVAISPASLTAQDRMARPVGPQPVQPSPPGNPQIQPVRPSPGRPSIQPPRPGTGGPQIQPPRPTPSRPRPPHNGNRPGFHRPPNYRPAYYHYPHGYHYRRWTVGAVLPVILFGSGYYFHDYLAFGLYPPPPHFRWVRYGPDLVLVDTHNGRVRDVRYGVFR